MDDRAQVSTEYLIILSILVVLAAVLTVISLNMLSARDSLKDQASILLNGSSEMVK